MTDKFNAQITAKDGRQFTVSLIRDQFHVLEPLDKGRPLAWIPIATQLVPADVLEQADKLRAEFREGSGNG